MSKTKYYSYVFVGILLGAMAGLLFTFVKVNYFEKTKSGMFAVHKECVQWNEACIDACEDSRDDVRGGSCSSCCILEDDVVETLGDRLSSEAKLYGLVFAFGPGLLVGLGLAEDKRKRIENV